MIRFSPCLGVSVVGCWFTDHSDFGDHRYSVFHFHSAYFFRSSVLSSLPVDVCGRSLTKTKSSGICHLANLALKKVRSSSDETLAPSFNATTARGRSCHLGCCTATTPASRTAGWVIKAFSRSTVLIHSPPDFTRSLLRSTSLMHPSGSMVATSPVRNQPSAVQRSRVSGAL